MNWKQADLKAESLFGEKGFASHDVYDREFTVGDRHRGVEFTSTSFVKSLGQARRFLKKEEVLG